jgi:hypothetical protein
VIVVPPPGGGTTITADLTAHWDIDHLHRWSSNRS